MPRPTQVSLYSYHVARVPFSTCRKTHWECHTLLKTRPNKVTAEGDVFRERYRHTRKKGKLRMLQMGVKPTIFRLVLHLSLKSPGLHMRILANFWKASRAVSWLAWPCVYFSARFHAEGEGHAKYRALSKQSLTCRFRNLYSAFSYSVLFQIFIEYTTGFPMNILA